MRSKFPPARLAITYAYYWQDFHQNEQKLRQGQTQNTWHIQASQPQYPLYVVVIGESARRDYHHLYGYPIANTPFLDKVNGTFWQQYFSAGPNTDSSLQRMLVLNHFSHSFDFSKTAIGLANQAGFKTYWLSNQGFSGRYATPISVVAQQSQSRYFTSPFDFEFNQQSDWQLLTPLDKVLKEKTTEPKLIFIHIMGSHSGFCQRESADFGIKPIRGAISPTMDCYLTSILQTDKLLESIYQRLRQTRQGFSLMYFSDHGLSHIEKDTPTPTLVHGDKTTANFAVPMVVISSDDKNRKIINAPKSGFDFIPQLAEWLGIDSPDLPKEKHFFDDVAISPIYVIGKNHRLTDLGDDPAILPKIPK